MGWIVGFKRRNSPTNEYVASINTQYLGLPGSHTTSRRKALIFPNMDDAVNMMLRSPISSTIMFIEEQVPYEGR